MKTEVSGLKALMELLCKGCIFQPSNFLWHVGRLPAYNYLSWAKYLQTYISDKANATAAVFYCCVAEK